MRKRRQQLAARAEESADNLVVGGTAGGSQDARGDAGHGVFLLLALPLGGLRLALSLALRCPRLAFRFPFSRPCLALRFLFCGLLLTLGFLLAAFFASSCCLASSAFCASSSARYAANPQSTDSDSPRPSRSPS